MRLCSGDYSGQGLSVPVRNEIELVELIFTSDLHRATEYSQHVILRTFFARRAV